MAITDVKSNLAKLLATENLTVEHSNVRTASFNVDTRVLTLPIWDNISNDIYNLLVGHEVGHAIYTPNDYNTNINFPRSFLNVVEDARIEKLMKRKYAGISKSFYRGYTELNDKDFFEIQDEDLEKMSLIDRINLHFKIGIHNLSTVIPFKESETQFVDMTAAAETFDDVMEVCQKIADFIREQKKEEEKVAEVQTENKDGESGGEQVSVDSQSDQQNESSEESEEESENFESSFDEDDFDDDEHGEGDLGELEESTTDQAWNRNQNQLIDNESLQRLYVTPPQVNWEDYIVPIEEFALDIDNYIKVQCDENEYRPKVYEAWKTEYLNFKKESNKSVSYLVKEFEMKKSADEYNRSSVAKTGVLDTNKLYSYKWSDDVFKKLSVVSGGKSHGLIMYVDWSGSMSNCLEGTVKQLINLIAFCKKVNIPFQVYAFVDNSAGKYRNDWSSDVDKEICVNRKLRLVEFFNSEVKKNKFEEQILRLWYLMKDILSYSYCDITSSYELGSTPLNDSIFAAVHIFKKFKSKYNVDKVNTVFLTDGESNHLAFNQSQESNDGTTYNRRRSLAYCSEGYNVCLKDPKTGYVKTNITENAFWSSAGFHVTKNLIEYYKWMTGSNVIGFRLCENLGELRYMLKSTDPSKEEQYRKLWKGNKYFTMKDCGYDELYVLESGSGFKGDDLTIQASHTDTKNKIRNQFRKYMKSKSLNKVILSKFVDQIA